MADNDFVMVELTPYGEALAGGIALRASNGRRNFVFPPATPVRVELSYEWNVLLSKMHSSNGQPIFQRVPAPAQTPADIQAAAVRASYDQMVQEIASPLAPTRTTATATLDRALTAAKLTEPANASTKAMLADLGAYLTSAGTDTGALTALAAAFTPPAATPIAVVASAATPAQTAPTANSAASSSTKATT